LSHFIATEHGVVDALRIAVDHLAAARSASWATSSSWQASARLPPPTVSAPASQTCLVATVPHDDRNLKESAATVAHAGCVLKEEDGESGDAIFS
jgi:hypothetical protein